MGKFVLGFFGQDEIVSNCLITCNIRISPTTTTTTTTVCTTRAGLGPKLYMITT
jgi:hypothetical protein